MLHWHFPDCCSIVSIPILHAQLRPIGTYVIPRHHDETKKRRETYGSVSAPSWAGSKNIFAKSARITRVLERLVLKSTSGVIERRMKDRNTPDPIDLIGCYVRVAGEKKESDERNKRDDGWMRTERTKGRSSERTCEFRVLRGIGDRCRGPGHSGFFLFSWPEPKNFRDGARIVGCSIARVKEHAK